MTSDLCRRGYAPAPGEAFGAAALSGFGVTFAAVVADTLLGTVLAEPALWTPLCADRALRSSEGQAEATETGPRVVKVRPVRK